MVLGIVDGQGRQSLDWSVRFAVTTAENVTAKGRLVAAMHGRCPSGWSNWDFFRSNNSGASSLRFEESPDAGSACQVVWGGAQRWWYFSRFRCSFLINSTCGSTSPNRFTNHDLKSLLQDPRQQSHRPLRLRRSRRQVPHAPQSPTHCRFLRTLLPAD